MSSITDNEWKRVTSRVDKAMMCEFSVRKRGKPLTYPLSPFYDEDEDAVFVTSAPGLSKKFERVEEEPEATMLLFEHGVPLLVKGTIRMKDVDPWEGGQYMIDMIREAPEHKRDVFTEGFADLPNSRLTAFLMDWYVLRKIAYLEPEEVIELPDSDIPDIPSNSAIDVDEEEAGKHQRAVLSAVDDDGYPICYPVEQISSDDTVYTLSTSGGGHPEGPACLLLHWYTEDIKQLGQRVIRGTGTRNDENEYVYDPAGSFETTMESELGRFKFAYWGKKLTREYFDESSRLKWTWDVSDIN